VRFRPPLSFPVRIVSRIANRLWQFQMNWIPCWNEANTRDFHGSECAEISYFLALCNIGMSDDQPSSIFFSFREKPVELFYWNTSRNTALLVFLLNSLMKQSIAEKMRNNVSAISLWSACPFPSMLQRVSALNRFIRSVMRGSSSHPVKAFLSLSLPFQESARNFNLMSQLFHVDRYSALSLRVSPSSRWTNLRACLLRKECLAHTLCWIRSVNRLEGTGGSSCTEAVSASDFIASRKIRDPRQNCYSTKIIRFSFKSFVSDSLPFLLTHDRLVIHVVNIFFSIIAGISKKTCRIAKIRSPVVVKDVSRNLSFR
jgi:hypothetical protein